MDWNAIATIAEVFSTLAILATLIFLSIQIKQGTKAARARSRRDLGNMRMALLEMNIKYPDIMAARRRQRLKEEIPSKEMGALTWWIIIWLREYETLVYHRDIGELEDIELERTGTFFKSLLENEPVTEEVACITARQLLPHVSETMKAEMDRMGLLREEDGGVDPNRIYADAVNMGKKVPHDPDAATGGSTKPGSLPDEAG